MLPFRHLPLLHRRHHGGVRLANAFKSFFLIMQRIVNCYNYSWHAHLYALVSLPKEFLHLFVMRLL